MGAAKVTEPGDAQTEPGRELHQGQESERQPDQQQWWVEERQEGGTNELDHEERSMWRTRYGMASRQTDGPILASGDCGMAARRGATRSREP